MTSLARDTTQQYGSVTRALHWSMAALFLWQYAGMLAKVTTGKSALTALLAGQHRNVGLMLLILCIVRILWALGNAKHRPHYVSAMAKAGHMVLYGLMLIIPSLALLRQLGSGKEFSVYGVIIQHVTDIKVEWMAAPANALHGSLAWLLLAVIVGHIAMALVHRYKYNDGVFARMVGKP